MSSMFDEAERLFDRAVAAIDIECMASLDVREFVRRMDRWERKVVGAKAMGVGELVRKDAWNDGSARSAADWVAQETGASWGAAGAAIALGEDLRSLPTTAEALREGRISGTQAALVARAATIDPHAEYRLLEMAQRSSVKELQAASDRVRATEDGALADQQAAIHRTRYLRTWIDREGAFRIDAKLTKAAGAKVLAVLEPYMETEFADARRQGRREQPDAYRADALVTMAEVAIRGGRRTSTEDGEGCDVPPASAHIIVRVDHAALVRGHVVGDEQCEIDGIGPVPVSDVVQYMSDPFITALTETGSEVALVSTTTRLIRKPLRVALDQRDRVCVVPGCGIGSGLEYDHLIPYAQGGPTSLDNLQRLCKHHHRLKTTGKAQLTRWETQDGPQFGWLPRTSEGEAPPPSPPVNTRRGGTDPPGAPERLEELFPDTGTG